MTSLEEIWEWIKSDGVAAIISGLTVAIPYIFFRIKTSLKRKAEKELLTLDILKEVANKEDVKPNIDGVKQEIISLINKGKESDSKMNVLADMVAYAFNNSALSPEVKAELDTFTNKIKYGTDTNEVEKLIKEKEKLQNELEEIKKELKETFDIKKVDEDESGDKVKIKKIRR